MPLDAFLQVWCMRGSQGLQADWLKPQEHLIASRVAGNRQTALEDTNLAAAAAFAGGAQRRPMGNRRPTSHTGLANKDYTEGINADGTLV